MRNAINIILIIFLFVINFNNSIDAQDLIKTFNLTKLPKLMTVKLSDLGFVDIEYIPLETNKQSLISDIDNIFFHDYKINKILMGNDYFLIKNGDKILKFKLDGSFIRTIGKIGRGPDELDHLDDIVVNKTTQNIFLVSSRQKRICLYSRSGELVKVVNIPFFLYDFSFIADRILCYCGDNSGINKNSFVLIDTLGHIVKSFPNKHPFKALNGIVVYTHENLFYTFSKTQYIKELYSDTIYSFVNMDFKPHMVLEVGNRLITPKVRSEYNSDNINANYIQPMNLMEFGDYVYFGFINRFIQGDVKILGFLGSKKNNYQAFFNLGEGLANDLNGGPNILPLTTKDDNTIVSLIDAFTLKKYITTEEFIKSTPKYPEKKKELEKMASSLKETDNPVLILVKLKK
jgi:hypothetical protein